MAKKEVEEVYRVWVKKMNKSEILKGYLLELGNEKMVVKDEFGSYFIIPIENIKKLKFRERNAVRKGTFTGAGIGLVVSGVAGIVYLFSNEKSENAGSEIAAFLGTVVILTGILAAYGSIQSSSKYSYQINGKIVEYKRLIKYLEGYVIKEIEPEKDFDKG